VEPVHAMKSFGAVEVQFPSAVTLD